MDNVIEVFDAKVIMRSTLHTLASIKELLWQPVKRVRVIDLLMVTRSAYLWSRLSNEDAVKVCLLLVVNIVFMDRKPKNYIADNLLELVDDLPAWDAYPWGTEDLYIGDVHKQQILVEERSVSYPTWFILIEDSNELLQPWFIRSMEYFGSHDVEHEPLLIDHEIPVGEKNVVALDRQSEPDVFVERQSEPDVSIERQFEPDVALEPQFKSEAALERQSEPDVPMFTKEELVAEHHAIKERVKIIENLADADPSIVLLQLAAVKERITAIETFLKYKNESMSEDSMAKSAISCVLIGEVSDAKSVSNEYVLQQLQSRDGKLPESSLLDVLNGEFSCDINRPNEHMSEEFVENELESCDGKDNAGFDFDNIENHSLNDMVRIGTEDIHLDELLSENGDQVLNTTDVVEGEKYENDVHVDQSLVEQKCRDLALYLYEVNFVNENEPPSAVKVLGQLLRKTYKGKALVEPYTVQSPTTASVHLDSKNTQSNKTRKRKDAIPLSKIAKSEFPLVEYCDDLSRPPYSRRNKVKLPKCIDQVITIADETTHLLAWGNYDIEVDRLADADWAIAGPYFCDFVMRESDIPGWVCNGVRYPIIWADVEQVFFSINKPRTHYCLGVLHIRSGVITLYDSMGVSVEETREWWSYMRIAFKTRIPQKDVPLQGDAYGDCSVWVCINLYRLIHKMSLSAKDPQKVGLAYREHMFDYFWKYKIAS
ncbi:transposase, MuDR, MULE transposase domain protein [Tanacetum coccineum]